MCNFDSMLGFESFTIAVSLSLNPSLPGDPYRLRPRGRKEKFTVRGLGGDGDVASRFSTLGKTLL